MWWYDQMFQFIYDSDGYIWFCVGVLCKDLIYINVVFVYERVSYGGLCMVCII